MLISYKQLFTAIKMLEDYLAFLTNHAHSKADEVKDFLNKIYSQQSEDIFNIQDEGK